MQKRVKGRQQFCPLSSVFYLDMTMGLIPHENEGLLQEGAQKGASSHTLGEVTRNERGEIQSASEKQSPGRKPKPKLWNATP
ncbi:hypothetical protein CEXT_462681 [Caerostris extrusa]|uniref:Uncharacterized protein n=1 Tax=Caerostris extrusa TaxID=172846 RepID=A0AAV4YF02_CAEEX|nr:hypothetical protein CEXT_462681 [Caerostris extrusa]